MKSAQEWRAEAARWRAVSWSALVVAAYSTGHAAGRVGDGVPVWLVGLLVVLLVLTTVRLALSEVDSGRRSS